MICGFLQFYNEHHNGNLQRAVANLRRFCGRVVAYDDGSTDDGGKWAEENTDLVVRGRVNDWTQEIAHKAQLLDAAKKRFPEVRWFFWLDCDEELSPPGVQFVRENVKAIGTTGAATGAYFQEVNLWRSKSHYRVDSEFKTTTGFLRLWRNSPDLGFTSSGGRLHQFQHPPAAKQNVIRAPRSAPVIHYSWDSPEKIVAKHRRYIELEPNPAKYARLLDSPNAVLEPVDPAWFWPAPEVAAC